MKTSKFIKRVKLAIVKTVCRLLLPRDVWIGMHKGVYTCEYDIHFGRLDSRGVLQGVSEGDLW